jgi:hypothetical protein
MTLQIVAALLLLLSSVGVALAQTTTSGRIVGTLVDAQGLAVPGATVTVTSTQLQGSRTSVSDASGEFRFLSLPPGTYSVKAELSGFQTVERNDIPVNVNSTVTLPLTLNVAGVVAAVTVSVSAPTVDTTSTQGGIVADADVFNNLPMRRDFYSVARLAPGAAADAVAAGGAARLEYEAHLGSGIYGGSGAENQYIIDGVNVTGMDGGEQTKTVNMDAVQQVQVMTTGLNAEYGRMNGGIISVVTQSGSNVFHGSGFGFYEGGGLVSGNSTLGQLPLSTTTLLNTTPIRDGGGSLGGFLLKDRIWFFGAYDRTASRDQRTVVRDLSANPGSPSIGTVVPSDVSTDQYAAKLTFRASNSHTIWASTNGEPSTRDGYIFAIAGPPSTWQGTLKRGAPNVTVHYDGVLGPSLLIRGIIGRDREKTTYGGAGAATAQLLNQTVTPNVTSGGFTTFTNQDFTRKIYKGDLTKIWGSHDIKAGADYEDVVTAVERFDGGGGQRIYQLVTGGVVYYRHRYFINDLASGFVRSNQSTFTIANPLSATPADHNTSFYAQDSYKLLSNLSLEYGIRWERQKGLGRSDYVGYDMKKNWAPRVAFVWDPSKAARSKLFASWGRYFDSQPLDMNIREFGGELECFCYNFSPDPANILQDPKAPKAISVRGGIEPTDPTMKGMYSDEWTAGAEYEVMAHTTVGAKLIRRSLGRAIEDFLDNVSGNYYIGNPSEGTFGLVMGSFAGDNVPAPKPVRKSTAVELTMRKNYSDNWQFLASYVWTKLEGNYDGSYQVSTGQLDPGINSAYDYADFLVNAQGSLSSERKNQLKLDGSYAVSNGMLKGLTAGGSFHWSSGLPLTAYGYSVAYANWEYYLTPRGALGRGPADYEGDVHIGYPIRLGTKAHANVMMDVFNVLNRQAISQLYQRYNEVSNGSCGGIPTALCNGDGGLAHVTGTINTVAQLANPAATAPSPDFLKAGASFTAPRSARIGVRFTF